MEAAQIWPMGYRVLVKPDPIEEKTKGGILLSTAHVEGHEAAQMIGTLVAAGPGAWKEEKEANQKVPHVGDRVLFARYRGNLMQGADGENYRLLNDNHITALAGSDLDVSELNVRESYDGTG